MKWTSRNLGRLGIASLLMAVACGAPSPSSPTAVVPAPSTATAPSQPAALWEPQPDRRAGFELGFARGGAVMGSFAGLPPTPTPATEQAAGAPEFDAEACVAEVAELDLSTLAVSDDPRLQSRRLLVADKGARTLSVFDRGSLTACWRIGLGFTPEGQKEVEGDGKTPIGWYSTADKPWSSFDGAISISYPSAEDARTAYAQGRIGKKTRSSIVSANARGRMPPQRTSMGGAILIHAGGSSTDWTAGCLALDEEDLTTLRGLLPSGKRAPILILP